MVFKSLKRTLATTVLAGSLALAPVAADAEPLKGLPDVAPKHMHWVYENKDEARTIVLGVNVGLGCLKSGIGSYMNDKGFFEGCLQGAFAGFVTYLGEHIASFNEYPMVGGAGKLVHDLGVSMSDNVMRGEFLLSQYQTEIGPVTFTFRGSLLPRISFTVRPLYGIIKNFADGQEFDFEQSLFNLTPVFRRSMDLVGFGIGDGIVTGYTTGNVVSYTRGVGELLGYAGKEAADINKSVLSHEFNHALVWSKFRFCSDLLNWVPTEKIPFVPEMEEIQLYWNVGQDFGYYLMRLPFAYDDSAYYYDPMELDAYSMQRP